jgi:hypothetical protein
VRRHRELPLELADAAGHGAVRYAGATVTLDLPKAPRVIAPHPRIDVVRGCVAVARGPLVYAVEQADLPDGVTLEDVRVDPAAPITAGRLSDIPVTLTARGAVERATSDELYPVVVESHTEPIELTAIPCFLVGQPDSRPDAGLDPRHHEITMVTATAVVLPTTPAQAAGHTLVVNVARRGVPRPSPRSLTRSSTNASRASVLPGTGAGDLLVFERSAHRPWAEEPGRYVIALGDFLAGLPPVPA